MERKFIRVGPRQWRLPAVHGWIIFVGSASEYYVDYQDALSASNAYNEKGTFASQPMPAHMGQ
jgi:hypothetical protein